MRLTSSLSRVILGLGNPGLEYSGTRHNVGFRVVEELAERCQISLSETRWRSQVGFGRVAGEEVALVLPQTFMNRSGEALGLILDEWPQFDAPQNLIVAYDDLDLPCGQIRLRRSGGAGGHRGMQSLIQVLGSGGFSRLRFGVGRPEGDEEVVDFVLSAFPSDQLNALEASMRHATEAVGHLIQFGMDSAMNQFN